MNIGKILTTIGGAALNMFVPGAGEIIGAINNFLPDDKKLPATATGHDAIKAVNSLPPEQQQQIMSKQMDVEIAEINSFASIQQSLAAADSAGHSTRPQIAMMMAKIVSFSVIVLISMWCVAMFNSDVATLKTLSNSTPWVVTVLGTPTTLLFTYFGKRTKEKLRRYSMGAGQQQAPGLLSTIAGMINKK